MSQLLPTMFSDEEVEEERLQRNADLAHVGEMILLEKLNTLLSGIPPPPSLATCRLSHREILERIKEHADLLELPSVDNPDLKCNPKVYYLNKGSVSEEIASLMLKTQARFVQCETLSTCTAWFQSALPLTASAKKRRQNWQGISPGRRLSHLARRRQVFSRANLQQLSQYDATSQRLAIKATVPKQRLKSFIENKKAQPTALPKRALFQSPEEEPIRPGFRTVVRHLPRRKLFNSAEKKNQPLHPPIGNGGYDVSRWIATQNFNGARKRMRDEVRESDSKRRCPRRSLDFSDSSPSRCSEASTQYTAQQSLSTLHKQKLLWAVSVALKERKITHKDPFFKPCATMLFNVCKKNLSVIRNLSVQGGTSEKMLHFARQEAPAVILKEKGTSDVLKEVSDSSLNSRYIDKQCNEVLDGKENVKEYKTPVKTFLTRPWKSCLKSQRKLNRRFQRARSCECLFPDSPKSKCKNISKGLGKLETDCPHSVNLNHAVRTLYADENAVDDKTKNSVEAVSNLTILSKLIATDFAAEKVIDDKNLFEIVSTKENEKETIKFASEQASESSKVVKEPSKKIELPDASGNANSSGLIEGFEVLKKEKSAEEDCDIPGSMEEDQLLQFPALVKENEKSCSPKQNNDDNENFIAADVIEPPFLASKRKLSVTHNDCNFSDNPKIDSSYVDDGYINADEEVIPDTSFEESSSPQKELANDQDGPLDLSLKCNLQNFTTNGADIDLFDSCDVDASIAAQYQDNLLKIESAVDDLNKHKSDIEVDEAEEPSDVKSPKVIEDEDRCKKFQKIEDPFDFVKPGLQDEYRTEQDEGSNTDNLFTSTPLQLPQRKTTIKTKPVWKSELGPGLTLRMRLSKEYGIVGRTPTPVSTPETSGEQFSCDEAEQSSFNRTETSTESYCLIEIRDRMAIERTLMDEPSEESSILSKSCYSKSSCLSTSAEPLSCSDIGVGMGILNGMVEYENPGEESGSWRGNQVRQDESLINEESTMAVNDSVCVNGVEAFRNDNNNFCNLNETKSLHDVTTLSSAEPIKGELTKNEFDNNCETNTSIRDIFDEEIEPDVLVLVKTRCQTNESSCDADMNETKRLHDLSTVNSPEPIKEEASKNEYDNVSETYTSSFHEIVDREKEPDLPVSVKLRCQTPTNDSSSEDDDIPLIELSAKKKKKVNMSPISTKAVPKALSANSPDSQTVANIQQPKSKIITVPDESSSLESDSPIKNGKPLKVDGKSLLNSFDTTAVKSAATPSTDPISDLSSNSSDDDDLPLIQRKNARSVDCESKFNPTVAALENGLTEGITSLNGCDTSLQQKQQEIYSLSTENDALEDCYSSDDDLPLVKRLNSNVKYSEHKTALAFEHNFKPEVDTSLNASLLPESHNNLLLTANGVLEDSYSSDDDLPLTKLRRSSLDEEVKISSENLNENLPIDSTCVTSYEIKETLASSTEKTNLKTENNRSTDTESEGTNKFKVETFGDNKYCIDTYAEKCKSEETVTEKCSLPNDKGQTKVNSSIDDDDDDVPLVKLKERGKRNRFENPPNNDSNSYGRSKNDEKLESNPISEPIASLDSNVASNGSCKENFSANDTSSSGAVDSKYGCEKKEEIASCEVKPKLSEPEPFSNTFKFAVDKSDFDTVLADQVLDSNKDPKLHTEECRRPSTDEDSRTTISNSLAPTLSSEGSNASNDSSFHGCLRNVTPSKPKNEEFDSSATVDIIEINGSMPNEVTPSTSWISSRNSLGSSGKKQKLSLESYKARKRLEPVFAEEPEAVTTQKRMYNIRLKNRSGSHKKKSKHRRHSSHRKRYYSDSDSDSDPSNHRESERYRKYYEYQQREVTKRHESSLESKSASCGTSKWRVDNFSDDSECPIEEIEYEGWSPYSVEDVDEIVKDSSLNNKHTANLQISTSLPKHVTHVLKKQTTDFLAAMSILSKEVEQQIEYESKHCTDAEQRRKNIGKWTKIHRVSDQLIKAIERNPESLLACALKTH